MINNILIQDIPRWEICPGSRNLEKLFPERKPDKRKNKILQLVKDYLLYSIDPETGVSKVFGDYVLSIADKFKTKSEYFVSKEIAFHYKTPYTVGVDCFFSIDSEEEDSSVRKVPSKSYHIFHFALGHKPFEIFENWLMFFFYKAVCAFDDHHGFLGSDGSVFHFHVIQPEASHPEGTIRRWSASYEELREPFGKNFYELKLNKIFLDTILFQDKRVPSAECEHCRARGICPELRNATSEIAENIKQKIPFDPTPVDVGEELQKLHDAEILLKAKITALTQQAIFMIESGQGVPHYVLQRGFTREKWKDKDLVAKYALSLGINIVRGTELITPNQAIKLGLPKDFVKQYTEIPVGEYRLVRDKPQRYFKKGE